MDNRKLEKRIARLEKLVYRKIKNENMELNNLEYISDDIERGLKRELGVNVWDIEAYPEYNDNYVKVTIKGSGYDVPNECVGIFKVYKRDYEYDIIVDDNKNKHIGSLDNLDEVVSMISDIMVIKGEDFYE